MWAKGGTSELVQVSRYICRIVMTERREERCYRSVTEERMVTISHTDMRKSEIKHDDWSRSPPPCIRPLPPRDQNRTPLSLVLVNAHVLTEVVVAAERLIATRERARERWLQGVKSVFIGRTVRRVRAHVFRWYGCYGCAASGAHPWRNIFCNRSRRRQRTVGLCKRRME